MRIGIALAAYRPNIDDFAEQLESIRHQSYKNWQCVITLDSPLAPLSSSSKLQPYFTDARFHWYENTTRLGHKKNFERAIQLTLNLGVDAIGCSDQDDLWYPAKLTVTVEKLRDAGPLSLVHCDMHSLAKDVDSRSVWTIECRGVYNSQPHHLIVRNVVAGCAMLMDAELVRKHPIIPEEVDFHDHWYALVASSYGGVYPIHQPLFAYRQHGANVVGVTPFEGVFHIKEKMGLLTIFRKCIRGWEKSHALARAADREGLRFGIGSRLAYLGRVDLGLGLIFTAFAHFRDDPALARAALSKGLGKFLSTFAMASPLSEEMPSRNSPSSGSD